ncbi:MAG: hypothetical protein PHG66_01705 [Candidatus Colwellbacteria bacterium]|nr:hypothetical protein [Candidatus Colwellbacteria bacterium]
MGATESKSVIKNEPKRVIKSESLFWGAWYDKTGDYSVGPAVTLYNDQSLNDYNRKMTLYVLAKHRRKDGKYHL